MNGARNVKKFLAPPPGALGRGQKVKYHLISITKSRTSDSLNEGLPIKMAQKSFKENNIFSMKKIVILTLELYEQVFFALDQYLLKNMGRKHCFCYSTYRK